MHLFTSLQTIPSVVETLKALRTMLFGCNELHIHMDHRNLTFNTLNSQRVLRWRLFIKEYNPYSHYIKGELNVLADALSCLPLTERQFSVKQANFPVELSSTFEHNPDTGLGSTEPNDAFSHHTFSVATDDNEML
jgi:hypothetical protein